MDNKIKQPTLTDLEKISKILTDFISQTKDADSGLRAKRGANISEIAKYRKFKPYPAKSLLTSSRHQRC